MAKDDGFFEEKIEELTIALEESVALQSYYAKLLNLCDGGKRIVSASADEWVEHLREIGKIEEVEN